MEALLTEIRRYEERLNELQVVFIVSLSHSLFCFIHLQIYRSPRTHQTYQPLL
jgi:hypothetical protein